MPALKYLNMGEYAEDVINEERNSHYLQLKLLSDKNVRAWVSMDFTQDKFSARIAIEKIKILGAPWELPTKQHCQFGQFGPNLR